MINCLVARKFQALQTLKCAHSLMPVWGFSQVLWFPPLSKAHWFSLVITDSFRKTPSLKLALSLTGLSASYRRLRYCLVALILVQLD